MASARPAPLLAEQGGNASAIRFISHFFRPRPGRALAAPSSKTRGGRATPFPAASMLPWRKFMARVARRRGSGNAGTQVTVPRGWGGGRSRAGRKVWTGRRLQSAAAGTWFKVAPARPAAAYLTTLLSRRKLALKGPSPPCDATAWTRRGSARRPPRRRTAGACCGLPTLTATLASARSPPGSGCERTPRGWPLRPAGRPGQAGHPRHRPLERGLPRPNGVNRVNPTQNRLRPPPPTRRPAGPPAAIISGRRGSRLTFRNGGSSAPMSHIL